MNRCAVAEEEKSLKCQKMDVPEWDLESLPEPCPLLGFPENFNTSCSDPEDAPAYMFTGSLADMSEILVEALSITQKFIDWFCYEQNLRNPLFEIFFTLARSHAFNDVEINEHMAGAPITKFSVLDCMLRESIKITAEETCNNVSSDDPNKWAVAMRNSVLHRDYEQILGRLVEKEFVRVEILP